MAGDKASSSKTRSLLKMLDHLSFTGVAGLSLVDVGNVVHQRSDRDGDGYAGPPIAVLFTLPQADCRTSNTANRAGETPLTVSMVARWNQETRHRPADGDQQHRGCNERDDHPARRVHQ